MRVSTHGILKLKSFSTSKSNLYETQCFHKSSSIPKNCVGFKMIFLSTDTLAWRHHHNDNWLHWVFLLEIGQKLIDQISLVLHVIRSLFLLLC